VAYVITEACIDCLHRSCVKECPVDCIYEGARALYIQPEECINCGACVPACPEEAIYFEEDLPEASLSCLKDNAEFFTRTLPGRAQPLGSPGSAARIGRLGVDTPLVAAFPARERES
jgi:NAD-dependent dihydropyrimidine dehydrogenase PreA subunit